MVVEGGTDQLLGKGCKKKGKCQYIEIYTMPNAEWGEKLLEVESFQLIPGKRHLSEIPSLPCIIVIDK